MTQPPTADFDVVIVGSGPSGVSAAFPLLKAGLKVLMVDGGQVSDLKPPRGAFLDQRSRDAAQWRWMIGRDFYALRQAQAVSPKLRVPTHAAIFDGFASENRIVADHFVSLGSLAAGGLSNAWGCGVACLTAAELAAFPVDPRDMQASYATVSQRIGVSGGRNDDLSELFGLDAWSQPAVPMDQLQSALLARYGVRRDVLRREGFRLGRSRVAVLTEAMADRHACDLSGTCLWGCERDALYSALHDLQRLRREPGFHYRPGFKVEHVRALDGAVAIEGKGRVLARRVLLAAGTLASTRLALRAIDHREPIAMQSCPTAAFLLWHPRFLGRRHQPAFGLGQLSFSLDLASGIEGFGSLFNASGIPVSEFARHLPLGKRYGVDVLSVLLSSCTIGNVFLPGALTDASLRLDGEDQLIVHGAYRDTVGDIMRRAQRLLARSFRRLGALLVPTSFTLGAPGSDLHYAASMPMRQVPKRGETNPWGELEGASGIHLIDGASLSALPAKSHTLTIMANADRIGRHIATLLRDTTSATQA